MRICLVSRQLYPYAAGGIARAVAATARALTSVADVTVVTSSHHAAAHRRLVERGDSRALPEEIRLLFVPEPGPGGFGGFTSYHHAYSARVHDTLREHFADGAPAAVEFCDHLAEGFVTIQALHTGAAWLADTLVCVRLHTTSELADVLDGHLSDDFETRAVTEAERYCLRHADRILWPGGDVLAAYRRYYGEHALGTARELRPGILDQAAVAYQSAAGPLRVLCAGPLRRGKGVQDLLRGLLEAETDAWELTIAGTDSDTGPLGTSMREQLALIAAEDPRVRFAAPRRLDELMAAHDVVAVPSRWDCWPDEALLALAHGRPVLATPVGGLAAMVQPGINGWLARGTGRQPLREAVEAILGDPQRAFALTAGGGPRATFDRLADRDALCAAYRDLAAEAHGRQAASHDARPLVSVVVPYHGLETYLDATLDSVASQTYPHLETIVVNDGSHRAEDEDVLRRAQLRPGVTVLTRPNAGLGAARNFGVDQARGTYVLPLDADDELTPTFVERLVDVLERDRELAYAGTWVQHVGADGGEIGGDLDGYMPFGNWSSLIADNNIGGACSVLLRRALFDEFRYDEELTSYEDWMLYRDLHDAGLYGAIVPERLFRYRLRDTSMTREVGAPMLVRLMGEMRARALLRGIRRPPAASAPRPGCSRTPSDTEALERANAELRAANQRIRATTRPIESAAAAAQLARATVLGDRLRDVEARAAHDVRAADQRAADTQIHLDEARHRLEVEEGVARRNDELFQEARAIIALREQEIAGLRAVLARPQHRAAARLAQLLSRGRKR